jgi:hypothetical protein
VKRWETQILSFFVTRRNSARSDSDNLVTEKLCRITHSLSNFDNYRLRPLRHSGVEHAVHCSNQRRCRRLIA